MKIEQFFENLEIGEKDFVNAEKYIKAKGLFCHLQIKNKLLAWTEDDKIKYSQIATYWQYLTYIITIISIIYAYFNKQSQSFHDKIAKTIVIKD